MQMHACVTVLLVLAHYLYFQTIKYKPLFLAFDL